MFLPDSQGYKFLLFRDWVLGKEGFEKPLIQPFHDELICNDKDSMIYFHFSLREKKTYRDFLKISLYKLVFSDEAHFILQRLRA